MSMDEYVTGKDNHDSFCYLVEVGTKELGDIRGIKASKIEAYADFFMFRWSLTRKMGLKKTIEALFNMVCGVRKNPNFTA